ncbi:hypothetical protein CKAH01_02076 [Colletotrichum kahawae]|uniref:Large ribosomal subunit protein mL67 n=1 Tax=Colletotrichum kahawae TaxID=34407 RepID=A0AAD9Y1U9_COLKA|nr:hypothetical protein CKAH01_02076 [Colletotrichum kahawae]
MLPVTLSKSLSQLSIGISRTSIRHAHLPQRRKPQHEKAKFPKGHGEQIWVWSHQLTRQVVYSHSKILKVRFSLAWSNRALRQLPFNGKKLQPQALRKDYWKPMALIQLPQGAGAAGQSVFQKLREFRRMHELCWDESLRHEEVNVEALPVDPKEVKVRRKALNKFERGQKLNDQYANSIADMAAVLAGGGRGNRLSVRRAEKRALYAGGKLEGRKWFDIRIRLRKDGNKKLEELNERSVKLLPVTVKWAVDADRNYAQEWSKNVKHELLDDALHLLVDYEPEVEEVLEAHETPGDDQATADDNIKYKTEDLEDDIPEEFREEAKETKQKAVDGDRTIREEAREETEETKQKAVGGNRTIRAKGKKNEKDESKP